MTNSQGASSSCYGRLPLVCQGREISRGVMAGVLAGVRALERGLSGSPLLHFDVAVPNKENPQGAI